MKYLFAILVIGIFSFICCLSFKLNNKVKVECNKEDGCEGCKLQCVFRNRED